MRKFELGSVELSAVECRLEGGRSTATLLSEHRTGFTRRGESCTARLTEPPPPKKPPTAGRLTTRVTYHVASVTKVPLKDACLTRTIK